MQTVMGWIPQDCGNCGRSASASEPQNWRCSPERKKLPGHVLSKFVRRTKIVKRTKDENVNEIRICTHKTHAFVQLRTGTVFGFAGIVACCTDGPTVTLRG